MSYKDKIIIDSDSKIVAIIGLRNSKDSTGYNTPFSRIFIFDDDKDKNKWTIKNEDWEDVYFDTTTGYWDDSDPYFKSKMGIGKFKL